MRRCLILMLCVAFSSSVHARTLQDLKNIYTKQMGTIEKSHAGDIASVRLQYTATLARQMDAATNEGDLSKFKALKATKEEFADGGSLPESSADQVSAIDAKRDRAIVSLSEKYEGGLRGLISSLMRSGDMASAEEAEAESKRVQFIVADLGSRLPAEPNPVVRTPPPSTAAGASKLPLALRKGLVLHYDFARNESRISDKSGEGNHGENHGAEWQMVVDGRRGVMEFNGESSYVEKRDPEFLNVRLDESLTYSCWVLCDPAKTDHIHVIGKSALTGNDEWVLLVYKGKLRSCASGPRRGVFRTNIDADFEGKKRWHHVVGIIERGTASLFVDGVLQKGFASATEGNSGSGKFDRNITNRYSFRLGRSHHAREPRYSFKGELDDVMIWSRALSKNEVGQLYRMQK